jgi:hypothetical protein
VRIITVYRGEEGHRYTISYDIKQYLQHIQNASPSRHYVILIALPHTLFIFSPLYDLTANSTVVASNKVGSTIQNVVLQAVVSNVLCEMIITRASYFNVTALLTITAKVGVGAVCRKTPAFATYILTTNAVALPVVATKDPTASPTLQPTPSTPPKLNTSTNRLYGILAIILIIAFLRLVPSLIDCCTSQKVYVRGHLYDILVVLSDKEEAILQNVRHEDIVYFREMTSNPDKFLSGWLMNNSSDPLIKRQEVQFWDLYDLLGQSGIDVEKSSQELWSKASGSMKYDGDKCITKQKYLHEASLQIGMIIRVVPSNAFMAKTRLEMGAKGFGDDIAQCRSRSFLGATEEMDRVPLRTLRLKTPTQTPRGQNGDVLDQLPSCFSSQDDCRVAHDIMDNASRSSKSHKSHKSSFAPEVRGSRVGMGSRIEAPYIPPTARNEAPNPDQSRASNNFTLRSEENSDMDDSTHCASVSLDLLPETLSDTEAEIMESKEKRLAARKKANMSWSSDGYYTAPVPVAYPHLPNGSTTQTPAPLALPSSRQIHLSLPHSFNTTNADNDANLLSERFTATNSKHYNSGARGSSYHQRSKSESAMKVLRREESRGNLNSRERRKLEEEKEQDGFFEHSEPEEEKSNGIVLKQEEKEN